LKVNIVHPNLNPCGGAERLSLATMHAVTNLGGEFDFTTYELPDKKRLRLTFGNSFGGVIQKAVRVNILKSALDHAGWANDQKYDIIVNTHVDGLPYYIPYCSKQNYVCYCNYPTAIKHIQSKNEDYLRETRIYHSRDLNKGTVPGYKRNIYFKKLLYSYLQAMKNSRVLTNSEFSKKAIKNVVGVDAQVLYPPVETEKFQSLAESKTRDDIILVLSRIVPYKTIEKAIYIAKILKQNKVGKEMKIIGNMYDDDYMIGNYYSKLLKMVNDNSLDDFISFGINLNFNKLIENMRDASVYLHTQSGEHFGISAVEAMSAGLIPVVPDKGGHNEFVPLKYQFNSVEKAAAIISSALKAPASERGRISNSVKKFSVKNFLKSFQRLLLDLW
jgi:alpha-1,2-mannosyltransferase